MSIKDIEPSKVPTVIVECCPGDIITIAPEDLYNIFFGGWHDEIIGISLRKISDIIIGDFDDRDNYRLAVVEINLNDMTCRLHFAQRNGDYSDNKYTTFPIKSFAIRRPKTTTNELQLWVVSGIHKEVSECMQPNLR